MTAPIQENQVQEQKQTDKELNFRNLEAKYQKELEKERAGRIEAERLAQDRLHSNQREEDDDSDPYIDHKKLNKKLAQFGEQSQKQTKSEIQQAVHHALQEERKTN